MANPNLARILSDAFENTLRTSEDPFRSGYDTFASFFGAKPRTHQQYLDRQIVNVYGDVVPRIATVRRHLSVF